MPKRSADDRIEHYKEKIKKLETRSKPSRRRIIYSSSDSSDAEEKSDVENDTSKMQEDSAETCTEAGAGANLSLALAEAAGLSTTEPALETVPELDPEILVALGTKTEDDPEYGDKIHDNLAQLWLPLLKKGMPKEDKDKILKTYLIPQNCTMLQAPKLNPEISAAITESARNRDKKMLNIQQQLGSGITAVNRAMDVLIGTNDDKLKAIKCLSDACRILSDLHHVETQARIKLITPCLDKNFLNIVQEARRDETLFGNKLSDKIKASKTIEKQGLQIKKSVSNPAPSTSAVRAPQQRGNWTGPPRFSSASTKMTRGGPKKTTSSYRKPNTTSVAQTKPTSKPLTRAQQAQQ